MKKENYDTIGFIRASQYRGEILKILSEDMKLPSEIAYDLKIRVSTVSNTLNDLKKYELIRCLNENAKKPYVSKALNNDAEEEPQNPAILIVDDLGVITYQLKVLLSKFDYDIDCSQEIGEVAVYE